MSATLEWLAGELEKMNRQDRIEKRTLVISEQLEKDLRERGYKDLDYFNIVRPERVSRLAQFIWKEQ